MMCYVSLLSETIRKSFLSFCLSMLRFSLPILITKLLSYFTCKMQRENKVIYFSSSSSSSSCTTITTSAIF